MTQEWLNELMWKSCLEWRKKQLRDEQAATSSIKKQGVSDGNGNNSGTSSGNFRNN